ncbi:MAG: hypothetical protein ACRDCT_03385, partial [Shewanella sp.]
VISCGVPTAELIDSLSILLQRKREMEKNERAFCLIMISLVSRQNGLSDFVAFGKIGLGPFLPTEKLAAQ